MKVTGGGVLFSPGFDEGTAGTLRSMQDLGALPRRRSGPGAAVIGTARASWLMVVALGVALHCYDLRDARGSWRGVAIVDEEGWRFEVYEPDGRRTESGPADGLLTVLTRRGLVETARSCESIFTRCFGRATRC